MTPLRTLVRSLAIFVGLFLFLSSILSHPASAGELIVNSQLQRASLDPHLDYVHDLEQVFHLGQIAEHAPELDWQSGEQRLDELMMEPGLYWFRGKIVNEDDQPLEITLQVEYPSINIADLYIISESGDIDTVYTDSGLEDHFSNRPVPHPDLVNPVTIPAQSSIIVIWRIHSEPVFQFRATVWNPLVFFEADQYNQMLYGMLYGILVVMALYNLFLYLSTQEKSYFFYVAYVLSAAYLLAADAGHIYQYVAPMQDWAKLPIYALAYSINLLMFGQFTIYFLNLRKHSRKLLRWVRGAAWTSAVLILAVTITSNTTLVYLGSIAITFLYLAALAAGIIVRRSGVISAGHFVIAIMILVFSLVATNMATLGLISASDSTESWSAIGTTIMLIFFSLALADRINQLQKENDLASLGIAKSNTEKLKAEAELLKSQTERIKLEQTTSQAKLESRAKSDFLATMSHEIRTPMNGVLGMTELMKSTELDDQQAHYLNTIESSGQSLLAIINDLQDFAKIEAGQMELEFASFNLETLLDDCISTFALRAVEKNLNFIADLQPSIDPVLKGDATKLRQIILNLLSNAFKFTDHGDILLTVRSTSKTAINCVELHFEIQDSGIGLTEDEQKRLFTPFQHADESTYGRYGGSGLGLAISKQLAELMDGNIGVSSESGKGSCFWFTARLLIDENPDVSLLREKSTVLARQRLLLVDPNQVSADIISRLLTSWHMEVTLCGDSEQALQKLTQAKRDAMPYDVILCEYNLIGDNGIHFAKQVRDDNHNNSAFVLMAASRYLDNLSQLGESGIEILLEKPITTALLHDVIKRAISAPHISEAGKRQPVDDRISKLNVLVVEDNQVNQLVIRGLLGQLHIEPVIAANGLQALEQYDRQSFDLILMDCEMPEMDGYEAAKRIRAKERKSGHAATTIVALSAHARSDYQERAQDVGMNSYLTKPIVLSDLMGIINTLTA